MFFYFRVEPRTLSLVGISMNAAGASWGLWPLIRSSRSLAASSPICSVLRATEVIHGGARRSQVQSSKVHSP